MASPIEALRWNIINAFERPCGSVNEDLIDAARRRIISATIDIDGTSGPPRAPRAIQTQNGLPYIRLHLTHMELLWSFAYGWMILYEEGVQKPMIDGKWTGNIVLDRPLTQRAASLLMWASTLRAKYTKWPEGLPRPARGCDQEETNYCYKANNVFQTSLSFLLYHEFAHVRQGHFRVHDPSDDPAACELAIELEREADDFAFNIFLSATDDEATRATKGWPLLMPVLSSLYLVDGLVGVFQRRHPHLHHRIQHMLNRFNFQDRKHGDYYRLLCACVLSVFSNAYTRGGNAAPIEPESFVTAEDALDDELDFLDSHGTELL